MQCIWCKGAKDEEQSSITEKEHGTQENYINKVKIT